MTLAFVALLAWLYLAIAHAGFWRIDREPVPAPPAEWPGVIAVIPARDEAAVIGETLRSLWAQKYPGGLRVVLVDDHSTDGTAEAARQTAVELGRISGPDGDPGRAASRGLDREGLGHASRRDSRHTAGRCFALHPLQRRGHFSRAGFSARNWSAAPRPAPATSSPLWSASTAGVPPNAS